MDRMTHRVHTDLLDQVAASEEEAREVRRILGPATWPGCCGACGQGRKPCPTPQACQICDDYTERDGAAIRWIAAGLLLTWAVLAAAGIAAFS